MPGPVGLLTRADSPPAGSYRCSSLLADVRVQVAGEAEHVAHHLVGDHVAEESPHVGQDARVRLQRGEHVMFEAGRERLHPSQAVGGREHRGRDLADDGIGAGHGGDRLGVVGRVDPLGPGCRRLEGAEPLGLDGRMDHQLHGRASVDRPSAAAGSRQSLRQVPGDSRGAVGRERRRAGPIASARSSAASSRKPWKSREETGTPPVPRAQGPVERAELGEPAPRRVDHRRAAGHRLARRAISGLGDDRVGRGDQVAARPVGRRDDVQVARAAARRRIIADEMDAALGRTAPAATSPGRPGRIGRCRDRPPGRAGTGRGCGPAPPGGCVPG